MLLLALFWLVVFLQVTTNYSAKTPKTEEPENFDAIGNLPIIPIIVQGDD